MRKMASIKEITQITPIENADRIESASIGGWNIVVQKGVHNVGDKVLFLEIDAFLPEDYPAFESFAQRSTKRALSPLTHEYVTGHVLKTAKLRGVYSQGAIVPLDEVGLSPDATQADVDTWAEQVGVFKYELPAVVNNPDIVGVFPSQYATKTDAERVQNLTDEFLQSLDTSEWYATEKVDGTSATFFVDQDGVLRAASRNYEISLHTEKDKKSPYQIIAEQLHMSDWFTTPGAVIQGEIMGEGIQGNKLKLKGLHLYVFHTNMDAETLRKHNVEFVPEVDMQFPTSVEEAVQQVDGMKSLINPKVNAEGIVWWNKEGHTYDVLDDRANFKAINNKFLLKNQDS